MQYKPSHISFSQIMSYIGCPEHYLFRYVLGIKSPPAKAMKQGIAIHKTLAEHYSKKKEDGKGLAIKEAQDVYVNQLKSAMRDYEKELEETKALISKDFLEKEKEMDEIEMIDAGTRGIKVYHEELEPSVKPDLVEAKFEIETNQDLNIMGYIDLTDEAEILHDTKTTRKSPNVQELGRDPQLAIYQIGYKKLKGKNPKSYAKDFIIMGKKEAKIQRFEIKKPEIAGEAMLRYIWNVLKAIQSNAWYCIHPANSWQCSKDWDGYYRLHQELREVGLDAMIKKYT